MIRDTFEANPGLYELFKRRILNRAHSVGLRGDLIDFESQIDMKGSYHENLRRFYRTYPELAEHSDYIRLKSPRPLSGVVLEQSWRCYEGSNANESPEPTEKATALSAMTLMPELTVTYTIRHESPMEREEMAGGPEAISTDATLSAGESNLVASTHRELMKMLLDRITATAGEKFTKTILHQIGGEIGRTAFHHSSRNGPQPDSLAEALDYALRIRGLGRVVDLEKLDHGWSVTYRCAIEECSLCHRDVAASSTCDVMRGVVSRWLESFLQKKAESTEAACVSVRSHLCIIHVTFRK
jgi:predicted ArsR family transcriptional regulator